MSHTNNKKLLLAGSAMVALSSFAAGKVAEAASVNATMKAEIIQPISLAVAQTLNFGRMTVGLAGTAVVDTTGGRTQTGGVNLLAGGGPVQEGIIKITAASGLPIDLSVTNTKFVVAHTVTATKTMSVNNFQLNTVAGGTKTTITLTKTTGAMPVGATLNVGAGQAAGAYAGTFTVAAAYQ